MEFNCFFLHYSKIAPKIIQTNVWKEEMLSSLPKTHILTHMTQFTQSKRDWELYLQTLRGEREEELQALEWRPLCCSCKVPKWSREKYEEKGDAEELFWTNHNPVPHTLHQGHLRMHQRAWSEARPRKGQGNRSVLNSVFVSYNSDLFKMPIQLLPQSNLFCLIVTHKGFHPLFKPTVFHGITSPSEGVREHLGRHLVAKQLSTHHSRILGTPHDSPKYLFPFFQNQRTE